MKEEIGVIMTAASAATCLRVAEASHISVVVLPLEPSSPLALFLSFLASLHLQREENPSQACEGLTTEAHRHSLTKLGTDGRQLVRVWRVVSHAPVSLDSPPPTLHYLAHGYSLTKRTLQMTERKKDYACQVQPDDRVAFPIPWGRA
eukprot:1149463-Pelagomonas_calceolata.AAC.4